jgi:hypothetical protein
MSSIGGRLSPEFHRARALGWSSRPVGSHTLVNVLAQTQYRGVVTACGLAQGVDLPGTVLFILRNVTLAGPTQECPAGGESRHGRAWLATWT